MQDSIGDYKVLEKVGAGSAAEVYRARDTRRGRTAAVKVLTSDLAMDPVLGPTFVTEANLAIGVDHPNVAALYEIDEHDGRPHLVFEFVPGQTLSAVLGGRPLNPRQAIDFGTQIADGLADAHAAGVVHRMLRPDNVVITPKGTAKILDAGLGLYAAAVARGAIASGSAPAAVAYWAPEQSAGSPGDHRADVWALGQVIIEMLTGRPPMRGQATAVAPGAFPPTVPPELPSLLARMVADAPDRRPASAATVAAELRAIGSALEARRAAAPAAPVSTVRKPPAPVLPRWAIAAIVLGAVAALVWLASAP